MKHPSIKTNINQSSEVYFIIQKRNYVSYGKVHCLHKSTSTLHPYFISQVFSHVYLLFLLFLRIFCPFFAEDMLLIVP